LLPYEESFPGDEIFMTGFLKMIGFKKVTVLKGSTLFFAMIDREKH
jgi:hypothetical protein